MRLLTLGLLLCLLPFVAYADDAAPVEINFLLASIGSSNCTFIRNGKRYDSAAAEDHLRMKYRNGKRYAPTSEKFIERLASKSYLSKKLYFIECEGEEKIPSGDWLKDRLGEYRSGDFQSRESTALLPANRLRMKLRIAPGTFVYASVTAINNKRETS